MYQVDSSLSIYVEIFIIKIVSVLFVSILLFQLLPFIVAYILSFEKQMKKYFISIFIESDFKSNSMIISIFSHDFKTIQQATIKVKENFILLIIIPYRIKTS